MSTKRVTPDWMNPIKWRAHPIRKSALSLAINDLLDSTKKLRKANETSASDLEVLEALFCFETAKLGSFNELWLEGDPQAVLSFLDQTICLFSIKALQGFCVWALRTFYSMRVGESVLGTLEVSDIDPALAIRHATFAKQKLTTSKRRLIGKSTGGDRNPGESARKQRFTSEIQAWIKKHPDLQTLDPRDDTEVFLERLRNKFGRPLDDGEVTGQDLLRWTRQALSSSRKAKPTLT